MRTFAAKSKADQQTTCAKPTLPVQSYVRQSHEGSSVLHLQRTIGNQAVQRLLQAKRDGRGGLSGATSSGLLGRFSRMPVHARSSVKLKAGLAVQRQPAKTRKEPAAEVWTEVEKGAYNNVVAAQKEVGELLADFNSQKLKFDDRRITEKLEQSFLYLREAWRTKVPVDSHAKLKAALASYFKTIDEIAVFVVLLPQTEVKEGARFWIEALRWFEVRMTPPKPTPAPPAQAVTDLRQEMQRQIDLWQGACKTGIGEFVHAELADRIDALSEGSWKNFMIGLLGNTVWAAAAFVPAGRIAFAVSMVGIGINMSPSIPQKSNSAEGLKRIEDQLYTYIEKIHAQLNASLPDKAAALLKEHRDITLDDAMKLFLEASFKPDLIKHPPMLVDETNIRQKMRDQAIYMMDLTKQVNTIGYNFERTEVAYLISPDYKDKKVAKVVTLPAGSNGSVRFLSWIPDEHVELALAAQRATSNNVVPLLGYEMWQQAASTDMLYLQWLLSHGWLPEDGFGLEYSRNKEKKSVERRQH